MTEKKNAPLADINNKIAKDIRQNHIMLGMTQKELANALGVTYQQVQKYENGKSSVSAARLLQITEILGISIPMKEQPPDMDDSTLKICARLMKIEDQDYKRKIKDAVYCLTA